MTMNRRDFIKAGATASLAASTAGWSPLMANQRSLIYTTIPSNGQQIPAIGIGTVDFRGSSGSSAFDAFKEILNIFHSAGGRVVDTSPNYGNSEVVLGKLMKDSGLRLTLKMFANSCLPRMGHVPMNPRVGHVSGNHGQFRILFHQ